MAFVLALTNACASEATEQQDETRPHVLRPTTAKVAEVTPVEAPVQAPDSARVPDVLVKAVMRPLVEYPQRDFDLSEVRWTVPKTMALHDLASQWGLPEKALRALNPELRNKRKVPEGRDLVVFSADPEDPTRSVGAPNRGKLQHGVPLPEGDAWRLRERRVNVYGSTVMVGSLLQAFEAYSEAFPDSEEIRLGDLSDRNGGRLNPHKSHRTGRDVDIGYVMRPDSRGEHYWQHANEETFDAEKNWFLIKALIETGDVQQIFMSSRLQALILPIAERELSPEQLARYFRRANPDPRSPSIIKHWKGHLDHMHVRFRCEEGNARCVARSH